MALTKVEPKLRARIEKLLQLPEWKQRSTRAIAIHLDCKWDEVKLVRRELRQDPKTIFRRGVDGKDHLIETKSCHKRGARRKAQRGRRRPRKHRSRDQYPLTKRQQALVAEAAPLAEHAASAKRNAVLSHDEVLEIAHTALMRAAKYWRSGIAPWKQYARGAIYQSIKKAFSRARQRLSREAKLGDHEPLAPVEFQPLVDALEGMTGLNRLLNEWVAGVDGLGPRDEAYLSEFLRVEPDVLQELILEAKEALAP